MTWPLPSTRRPPGRSSTPPRRRSGASSLTSAWPPTGPPCSEHPRPRKRLFPPPRHPATGKPLHNKGPEGHTVLTVNGRITLSRHRYYGPGVGSCFPLDCWLDEAEGTVSLGLR